MRFTTVLLLSSLVPSLALASPPAPKDKYLCDCHLTPEISRYAPASKKTHKDVPPPTLAEKPAEEKPVIEHRYSPKALRAVTLSDYYPGNDAIVPSNKLALPAGKAVYAKGTLVFLSGRVLDEHCVPVSDAVVDIWQRDPQGRYVRSTLGDRVSPDPHFTGSGRAVTDNLGRFNFVTLFPGSVDGQAPHINVHVSHKDLRTLGTKMYFEGDYRNASDPQLTHTGAGDRKLLLAKTWQRDANNPAQGLNAQWDISLKGSNPWRHF